MAVQKKTTTAKVLSKLSLIIPCYNEEPRISQMVSGLLEFQKKFNRDWEIILIDDGSTDATNQVLQTHSFIQELKQAGKLQIIQLIKNAGKGFALKRGVASASGTHVLTLDADISARPLEVERWLQMNGNSFPQNEIWIASREHKQSQITETTSRRWMGRIFNLMVRLLTPLRNHDTQCGFKLYPIAIAQELFLKLQTTGWAHDVELLYRAHYSKVPVRDMPIKWETKSGSKISPLRDAFKMFFSVLLVSARLKVSYFAIAPLRALLRKNTHNFPQEEERETIFRGLFFYLSFFLFILMTSLSFQYGITGDDLDQKIYGEKVLAFYTSFGKDTSCLNLKVGNKENLELYGGLFNMIPAAASKVFPKVDAYNMRHLFDSIAGFLAILFAGLLAKKIGGWRPGFLTVLLLGTWPQFFGQSMNNPKDIPFAFAYVFSIYYLLKLVAELPRPSTRTLLLSACGIALTINMRVGGLLLIGMLFAFVIGNYILSRKFRQSFSHVKGSTSRVTKYLIIISIAGYFGGLLFWPYGLIAPLSNPFIALKEITGFSVNIRILFDGNHLFSSEIPWYYIPKWILVTTPLVVLIGFIALPFLLPFLRKHFNINHLLLLLFATLFPWAYAAYKHSPMYDGLRQMLFLLPLMAVLASASWEFLMRIAKTKIWRYAVAAVIALGIFSPLRFSFANHPNQYVYFNEWVGGIRGAYGNFDTDYYMNSIRECSEWILKNYQSPTGKKLTLTTNAIDPVRWYFKDDTTRFNIIYTRYYERSDKDWDLGIFFSRPVDRSQLLNNTWTGTHNLFTVTADGIPLSVVVERKDKSDFMARQEEEKGNLVAADSLYRLAVKYDPKNESALASLGRIQLQQQNWAEAIVLFNQSLSVYPSNPFALYLNGIALAQSGKTDEAIQSIEASLKINSNNPNAYQMLGQLYQLRGETNKAQQYFNMAKQMQQAMQP